VLVLLIDDPHGPRLLLTVRAAALSNYPGYLVFPGGAVEPTDDGPAATALREAAEELGLDPASVHIVGQLPTIPVPATGFSATPVLAWCTALEVTGPTNPDEVAAIVKVPLAELAQLSARVRRVEPADAMGAVWQIDGRPVEPMTASVIELLVGRA
jgi:8-oxo-dGTP pyrophosphatase MutT (NUDIX family)